MKELHFTGMLPAGFEMVEIPFRDVIKRDAISFTNLPEFDRKALMRNFPFMRLLPLK